MISLLEHQKGEAPLAISSKAARGHSFSNYARRGERGRVKAYAMRIRGEGELKHLSAYAKKSLLSCFVVYGDDFHCCAKKHLL